ncbi:MAG: hypothetical protein KDI30_04680, partial [Pseudomonadales bacterium]|nr:hypothetical protein [Pseudomonadales bacterium]
MSVIFRNFSWLASFGSIQTPPGRSVSRIPRLLFFISFFLALPAMALDKSPDVQSMPTQRIHMSLLQDITMLPGNRLVAVGERGHIAYSDDNGQSWHQAAVPTKQMMNAVFFASEKEGWAVGYDGLILHSLDAGETWAIQLDGLAFSKLRASYKKMDLNTEISRLSKKVENLESAIGRASDDGEDVEELEMDLEDAQVALEDAEFELDLMQRMYERNGNTANPLMDVYFVDGKQGYAVGAFNTFLVTEDGGKNWSASGEILDNPEGMHLNAIAGSGDTLVIAGEAGLLLRSTDRGASWEQIESPDYGSFFGLYLAEDTSLLQVVGLRGAMFQSEDLGDSWEKIPEGLHKNMNAIYHGRGDLVLAAGNDGAWFRSLDGGQSFE